MNVAEVKQLRFLAQKVDSVLKLLIKLYSTDKWYVSSTKRVA